MYLFPVSIVVDRRESMGGEEYYNVTMESLKPDTSTKVLLSSIYEPRCEKT